MVLISVNRRRLIDVESGKWSLTAAAADDDAAATADEVSIHVVRRFASQLLARTAAEACRLEITALTSGLDGTVADGEAYLPALAGVVIIGRPLDHGTFRHRYTVRPGRAAEPCLSIWHDDKIAILLSLKLPKRAQPTVLLHRQVACVAVKVRVGVVA